MKTAVRFRIAFFLVALIVLALAIALTAEVLRGKTSDPHEGQVYINDGFDMVWMTPLAGVDVNPLTDDDFTSINGRPHYKGDAYDVSYGVDVSEHQWDIDWAAVSGANVDFAYIRLGYRGNTEGGLFEDPYFRANMQGAAANGIDLGVYFYSQALNVQEAIEEAEFVIERLGDYKLALPVVFDWEKVDGGGARTDNMDYSVLNDCAIAFCERIKGAGYEPAVYFNRFLGYYGYDLSLLTAYKFWLAVPNDFPDFYYRTDIWQYSFTSAVPGIEHETDMNMLFTPRPTASPEPTPAQ